MFQQYYNFLQEVYSILQFGEYFIYLPTTFPFFELYGRVVNSLNAKVELIYKPVN